jgi:hypothetical protein
VIDHISRTGWGNATDPYNWQVRQYSATLEFGRAERIAGVEFG